jgi:hypothetical protein
VFALPEVLAAILISLLISRIATVALTLTGLSRDGVRFRSRSALSLTHAGWPPGGAEARRAAHEEERHGAR